MTSGRERAAAALRGSGPRASGRRAADAAMARASLERQLHEMPAFRALLRAVESTLLEAAGPFELPLLDLGCGDGHFAQETATLRGAIGIDPDLPSLAEARHRRGIYRTVIHASATEMPFPSACFATVIANSVLEHIPDLESTLREVGRVLRPGGRFLITSPSHRFPELLLGSTVLRGVSLHRAAAAYGAWFNGHSRHFHTLSSEAWSVALARHGMRLEETHYYFTPQAQRVFDALHYLGAPTLVARKALGRWIPWRNPLTLHAAMRWLGPLADPRPIEDGACVWCVARRLAGR